MENVIPKDEEKFLTTFSSWDIEALIRSLPNTLVPTCIIQIEPKTGRTGLLEERGQWITAFWKQITKNNNIQGHRYGWTELVFFSPSLAVDVFNSFVIKHLQSSVDENLKSLAIFSFLQGSFEEQIQELEKMGLQLNKINYWKNHIYPAYYENGVRKQLPSALDLSGM